ncbi:DUF2236 domain-containing protein [Novosphingobium sp. FGD1]|uniref:DUF2236 domain-containing protein n=1 Tax=Novosphingobium silvae TaxID=2692619 RepID=A0A7X4K8P7_9SPHN|nr:DUF2236 domain-containing protein [Novosphingobium silvae]
MSTAGVTSPARALLVRQVRAIFNDYERGDRPVVPSPDALFKEDTAIRLVHADVVAMMVGGMRALLLQMLHPAALQGVLDHSDFRRDVQGRLRRTARFIALTTYAHRDEAQRAIETVNAIHTRVRGTMPDGRAYSATDPRVLAWVHVAEATSFLDAYVMYGDPAFPPSRQDEYFAQSATIAEALGAAPVPRSRAEALALIGEMRGELVGSAAAREVARFLLKGDSTRRTGAIERTLWTAAVDLLPAFARPMLGLERARMSGLSAMTTTRMMARTIRWAFAGSR